MKITGATVKANLHTAGDCEIIAYGNNLDKDEHEILGNYASKERAQEILYNIILRYNSKDFIFEMPDE